MSKTAFLSSDGDIFEVDEMFATECMVVKNMNKYGRFNGALDIRITSKILSMVIHFCNKHLELSHVDLKAFDSEFVKVDLATLIDLIRAAYRLQIKSLLELTCKTVADMITDKNVEEVYKIFNMENDFTPKDMEDMRKIHSWAFK